MSEAFGEKNQHFDETNRQLHIRTAEGERLSEPLRPLLSEGQVETARFQIQLTQEGEQSRAIIESTRAQANTSQRTRQFRIGRPSGSETQPPLLRKLIWTTSSTSCAFLRKEQVS